MKNTFAKIHQSVRKNLQASRAEMILQQHKRAIPVIIAVGDTVMFQVPDRSSKLAPKFVGPRLVVGEKHGNKFEVLDSFLQTLNVIHSDRLKKIRVTAPQLAACAQLPKTYWPTNIPPASVPTHVICGQYVDFTLLCRYVVDVLMHGRVVVRQHFTGPFEPRFLVLSYRKGDASKGCHPSQILASINHHCSNWVRNSLSPHFFNIKRALAKGKQIYDKKNPACRQTLQRRQ